MFGPTSGLTRAFLLIALALGYIVCCMANKEEKFLKNAGFVIGTCIIILGTLLLFGNLFLEMERNSRFGYMKPSSRARQMMMRKQQPPSMPMMPRTPRQPQQQPQK